MASAIDTTTTTTSSSSSPPPWHAAYPTPRNQAPTQVSRAEVRNWILERESLEKEGEACDDFVLIDLRRIDHEGGTIRHSINLPAHTLYPSIPTLYRLFRTAGVKDVVFWCSSSRGRGPRAAGWFDDYLQSQPDRGDMRSLVLEGGVKGWATAGPTYVALMEGYQASCWEEAAS